MHTQTHTQKVTSVFSPLRPMCGKGDDNQNLLPIPMIINNSNNNIYS